MTDVKKITAVGMKITLALVAGRGVKVAGRRPALDELKDTLA